VSVPAAGWNDRGDAVDEKERAVHVQRAVKGDADALQQLIVYYHRPLFGTISGRMDAALRRRVDPDDILQQAYITAFKVATNCTFDGPGGFYKWLEQIALDRLRDTVRDLRRKKRDIGRNLCGPPVATTSYPDLIERLSVHQSTPSRHLAHKEASAAILSSLARLSDDQRNVVRMRFLEGRRAGEIAAALGKSEDAVYALCHRGLKALEKLMVSITRYMSRS